ncbi:hypothetical protein [Leptospira interrogans]|uniref:hypothetical protein n=1 Tax=Leptospira interrogans TaxID=173 RepID=UPI001F105ABE|nr:hypothetical protein [Leptospira interrogans]UMQ59130.1 hypothetical protein FH585_05000 [Leptospira interrogans]
MTVNTSGKWWIGSEPTDIAEFLSAYSQDGYPISEFRLSKCECGSVTFGLEADDNEGVARRLCTQCGTAHFICDSAEHWPDAEPEQWKCIECDSLHTNVGVGFAMHKNPPSEIHWLYVGCRCTQCGVLGCFAEWKVGYSSSSHLLDTV